MWKLRLTRSRRKDVPVSVNSDLAESLRREKARNLRYKKAIHADLNLESIGNKLMEMYESASDVL